MLFGNKIVKIEILSMSGALIAATDKNFVFPKNLESSDDSILILKGTDFPELDRDVRVDIISYTKSGDRVKYPGVISMSLSTQLNVRFIKANGNEVLEERRRFFKIKVNEKGRALFTVRGEDTLRFEEPVPIEIKDINIGGVFLVMTDAEFRQDDTVCVDIFLSETYTLKAMVKILRVQRSPDGNVSGYGCEFTGLTAAQEDEIGRYINRIQKIQRAKQEQ